MFRAATLVILNKVDLLPYLDFSVERAISNVQRVHPGVTTLKVSARTGEGIGAWYDWIRSPALAARQFGLFDDGGAIAFAHTGIRCAFTQEPPLTVVGRVRLAGCRLGYSLAICCGVTVLVNLMQRTLCEGTFTSNDEKALSILSRSKRALSSFKCAISCKTSG
jgi:hypothetical protein